MSGKCDDISPQDTHQVNHHPSCKKAEGVAGDLHPHPRNPTVKESIFVTTDVCFSQVFQKSQVFHTN